MSLVLLTVLVQFSDIYFFQFHQLLRATTNDDSRGVGESLNEQEFGQGLVARGTHFVTLGSIKEGNSKLKFYLPNIV